MTSHSRLDELLDQWETFRRQGKSVSIDELCRECPDLKDELRRQIQQLERLNELMATQAPESSDGHVEFDVPTTLGRYQLDELIGQGGFGQVWRAYDPELKRQVAIKVLRPDKRSLFHMESFVDEATKIAKLNHKNIVSVYDVGLEGSLRYMVTELIEGCNLAQRLKEGRLSESEAVRVIRIIADALQHAHENGVVHRDVKPQNILLDAKQEPYITDFGIAVTEVELQDGDSDSAGTPAYMAPEQSGLGDTVIDRRCDIYSLGVVLWELIANRQPFSRSKTGVPGPRRQQLPPLSAVAPTVSQGVEKVCQRALSIRPSDRYFTAKEMADALRIVESPQQWKLPKIPVITAAVTVGFLVIVILIAGAVGYFRGEPVERSAPESNDTEVTDSDTRDQDELANRFAAARKIADQIESGNRQAVAADDRTSWESERLTEIQRAISQHKRRWESVNAKQQFDPEYFASLIILSAHEGLEGEMAEEWRLLGQYWREFSQRIDVSNSMAVFEKIDQFVFDAGLFFQEQLDGGEYDAAIDFDTKDLNAQDAYFQRFLVGHYHWPRFAAIWPFERRQRDAFAWALGITTAGPAGDTRRLGECIPRHPHDYLELMALQGTHYIDNSRFSPANPYDVTATKICGIVIQYYANTELSENVGVQYLEGYPFSFLHPLDEFGPEEWQDADVSDFVECLKTLSKSVVHHKYSRKAAGLLADYEAHEALLAGEQTRAGVPMFSIRVERPEMMILINLGHQSKYKPATQLRRRLAAGIRGLPSETSLNIRVAGDVDGKGQLAAFQDLQRASAATKLAAVDFVTQDLSKLHFYDSDKPNAKHSFSNVLLEVIDNSSKRDVEKTELLLVVWDSDSSGQDDIFRNDRVPQVWEELLKKPKLPKVNVISKGDADDYPYLRKLAELTGGSALLFKRTDGVLDGGGRVERWADPNAAKE